MIVGNCGPVDGGDAEAIDSQPVTPEKSTQELTIWLATRTRFCHASQISWTTARGLS
jgi:hypothetical protein